MDFIESVCVVALALRHRKRKRPHREFSVHPQSNQRYLKGHFCTIHNDLREYPKKFFNFYRMNVESFDELVNAVGPVSTYQDTVMRKCIPLEERISVTLRYLASGNSFISLHYQYLLGETTIGVIVKDTCEKIWSVLQPLFMPELSEKDWIESANKFYKSTQFPSCVGAVDGKHIRVIKPGESGSEFLNYKNIFSIVLLAIVDSNYSFLCIDVGSYGKTGDSNIFKSSDFGRRLVSNELNIPKGRHLPNDLTKKSMPFVIVGDAAFGLTEHVMKPFTAKHLGVKERVFNYRLTRVRRMVECAFGILANKWRIFHRALDLKNTEDRDTIVKASCIIHNFVRRRDGVQFEDTLYTCPLDSIQPIGVRGNRSGESIREHFANYFVSPQGSVPWQYDKI